MSAPAQQVLFDTPGPKGRRNNVILSILSGVALAAVLVFAIWKLYDAEQLEAEKWIPFTYTHISGLLWGGMVATLQAAAVATVLALAVGVVFALLRLSKKKWLSFPGTIVLEFFRGVPVLLLIFSVFYLGEGALSSFWAVVIGLMLYNGMVIAEIIRAGILAVPNGQKEAAMAIGLRPAQSMRLVLMPQAIRAMMPTLIAQIVVLLKDSALGYIVAYRDLLAAVNTIGREYQNLLPTFLVGAAIYIAINMVVAGIARWVERRLQQPTSVDSGPAKGED